MEHADCVDAFEREVHRSAELLEHVAPGAPISTCPGWTVTDLVEHLGVIHRWVAEMVRTRSPVRLPREEMTFALPDPTDLAAWLRSGGEELVAELRTAGGDEPMWAWGPHQQVRFWSRRQLHETAMHRIDLALACGDPAELEPEIAHDSILELLDFIPYLAAVVPHLAELRGDGETIAVRACDGPGIGTITLRPSGFEFARRVGDADASISGSTNDLALAVSRRLAPTDPRIEISGRTELVDHWITHSALD